MVILPSEDLRMLATKHRKEMPSGVRMLLRGIGGSGRGQSRLLSYLLFEREFTRELIDLGYRDAMRCKEQLRDFVNGDDVPRLFAPDWVKQDLDILHRRVG